MAEYLRFSTNIPAEVALRYPEGKQVPSRIEGGADQMMFSLAKAPNGETVMYTPLHIADILRDQHIGPGELFSIGKFEVKEGNRRVIRWQVARVDPDPRWEQPEAPAPAARPGTAAPPQAANHEGEAPKPASTKTPPQNSTPVNGNGTAKAPVNGNGHATLNGIPYWDAKTELKSCYEEAIDVLVAIRASAAAKGLPVQFSGEDLRQAAATLYIDRGKDRRTPWNGATR